MTAGPRGPAVIYQVIGWVSCHGGLMPAWNLSAKR